MAMNRIQFQAGLSIRSSSSSLAPKHFALLLWRVLAGLKAFVALAVVVLHTAFCTLLATRFFSVMPAGIRPR